LSDYVFFGGGCIQKRRKEKLEGIKFPTGNRLLPRISRLPSRGRSLNGSGWVGLTRAVRVRKDFRGGKARGCVFGYWGKICVQVRKRLGKDASNAAWGQHFGETTGVFIEEKKREETLKKGNGTFSVRFTMHPWQNPTLGARE